MSTTIQHTVKSAGIDAQILSDLDKLSVAHSQKKAECFAKGLPFYTCIDSVKDVWTKELSNGQIFLVKRDFDFKKDDTVDSLIRELGNEGRVYTGDRS